VTAEGAMPTIREVHDAFERLIAEQEQLTSRLHEEANSLNQSAADAVEGVHGTIAEVVRSVIIDEASLTMLAAEGEPAPLASDDHDRGGNSKRVSSAGFRAGNLHRYWDTEFVRRLGPNVRRVAADLNGRISEQEVQTRSQGGAAAWAMGMQRLMNVPNEMKQKFECHDLLFSSGCRIG
jgi:hypothetical protein